MCHSAAWQAIQFDARTARIVPTAPADAPKTTIVRPHRERPSDVLSVKEPSVGCSVSFAAPRCCSTAPKTLVNQPRVAKVSRVEVITRHLYPHATGAGVDRSEMRPSAATAAKSLGWRALGLVQTIGGDIAITCEATFPRAQCSAHTARGVRYGPTTRRTSSAPLEPRDWSPPRPECRRPRTR